MGYGKVYKQVFCSGEEEMCRTIAVVSRSGRVAVPALVTEST